MKHGHLALLGLGLIAGTAHAQDESYIPESAQAVGYGDTYLGPASVGSGEPLFRYDDQEKWKHGYIRNMPYYEGYHSFRPYNYHHVFSQAQTSAGWGMPATMPYSQQFWHRYEKMTDLSRGGHSPVAPYVPPPDEWDHYPKPVRDRGAFISPDPAGKLPHVEGPAPLMPNHVPPLPPQLTPSGIPPAQAASWNGISPAPATPLVAPY